MWVWVLEAIASLETLKAEDYDAEYRIAKPDGMVRWIGDRGFLVREEQRQIYSDIFKSRCKIPPKTDTTVFVFLIFLN